MYDTKARQIQSKAQSVTRRVRRCRAGNSLSPLLSLFFATDANEMSIGGSRNHQSPDLSDRIILNVWHGNQGDLEAEARML